MAIKGQCRSFPSLLLLLSLVGGKYIYKPGDDNKSFPPPILLFLLLLPLPPINLSLSHFHKAGDNDDGDGDSDMENYEKKKDL